MDWEDTQEDGWQCQKEYLGFIKRCRRHFERVSDRRPAALFWRLWEAHGCRVGMRVKCNSNIFAPLTAFQSIIWVSLLVVYLQKTCSYCLKVILNKTKVFLLTNFCIEVTTQKFELRKKPAWRQQKEGNICLLSVGISLPKIEIKIQIWGIGTKLLFSLFNSRQRCTSLNPGQSVFFQYSFILGLSRGLKYAGRLLCAKHYFDDLPEMLNYFISLILNVMTIINLSTLSSHLKNILSHFAFCFSLWTWNSLVSIISTFK